MSKHLNTLSSPLETLNDPAHLFFNQQFQQFSPQRQSKIPDFYNRSIDEKAEIIAEMNQQLEYEYYHKLTGPKIRHCSGETKTFCWNWFIQEKNIALKEEAVREYDFRIAFEESLTHIFETFSEALQKKFERFYESRFDQKELILKTMSEEADQEKKLETSLEAKRKQLESIVARKLIVQKISFTQADQLKKTIQEKNLTEDELYQLLELAESQYQEEITTNTISTVEQALQEASLSFTSPALDKIVRLQSDLVALIQLFPVEKVLTKIEETAKTPTPQTKLTAKQEPEATELIAKPESTPEPRATNIKLQDIESLQTAKSQLNKALEQKQQIKVQDEEGKLLKTEDINSVIAQKKALIQQQRAHHLRSSLKKVASADQLSQQKVQKVIAQRLSQAA